MPEDNATFYPLILGTWGLWICRSLYIYKREIWLAHLKEPRQVEEDGEEGDEGDVEVELEAGEVVARAADEVGDEADADVALPAEDDGAVDGGHEGDLDEGQQDGHDAREDRLHVVGPQVGQAVHHRARDDHLERKKLELLSHVWRASFTTLIFLIPTYRASG